MDGNFDIFEFDTTEMIDIIRIPIFILDVISPDNIVFNKLNREHELQTGSLSKDFEGKRPDEILPARMAETVTANYRRCVDLADKYVYEEVLRFDDSDRWWETTLSPVLGSDGTVIKIYGVASEITDRKNEEFRRTEAFSDLKKLNDHLNTFSAMAAHDLRGPLRRIRVLTDMLMQDLDDGEVECVKIATSCNDVAERALGYVDDVLGYSRALQSEPAKPEQVDLGHTLSDVAALLDPQKKFDIEFPSVFAKIDRVASQMILHNLIDNAVKHAKSQIQVTIEPDQDQSGNIIFTIADDGNGFDNSAQKIGEPLTPNSGSVSGFGLAAILHIAEARNGLAWTDEPIFPGGGATIKVSMRGTLMA